jgi:hypothetical protein
MRMNTEKSKLEIQQGQLDISASVNVSLPSRESIRKIIELTTHDFNGDVWGDDTVLGTMDELIDAALEILRNEALYTCPSCNHEKTLTDPDKCYEPDCPNCIF